MKLKTTLFDAALAEVRAEYGETIGPKEAERLAIQLAKEMGSGRCVVKLKVDINKLRQVRDQIVRIDNKAEEMRQQLDEMAKSSKKAAKSLNAVVAAAVAAFGDKFEAEDEEADKIGEHLDEAALCVIETDDVVDALDRVTEEADDAIKHIDAVIAMLSKGGAS